MNTRENIGQQIAQTRNKKGISTRGLAESCGVNYSNISKIERGVYNVSIDILGKICNALDAEIVIVPKGETIRDNP